VTESSALADENTGMPANAIHGAVNGQDARILADIAREMMASDQVLVHVALDDNRAAALTENLEFFAPDVDVVNLPAWDCLPYDRVSPNGEIVAQRVAALSKMLVWQGETKRYPRIVITTVNAALQKVMPRAALKDASFMASVGQQINLDHMMLYLSGHGYHRTDTVREAGEFAVRGSIIDIFPPGFDNPVRFDLFGDEIETLRKFDALSQRSGEKLDHFVLQPVGEFSLNADDINAFRGGYREAFGVVRDDDPLYEAVSEGRRYAGMEHWLPLFYERMESLFEYAANADGAYKVTLDHHADDSAQERTAQTKDFFAARMSLKAAQMKEKAKIGGITVYHPLPVDRLYEIDSGVLNDAIHLSPFAAPDVDDVVTSKKGRDFSDIRAAQDGDVFAELKKYLQAHGEKLRVITAHSEGSKERLKTLLENAGIDNLLSCSNYKAVQKLRPSQIGLTVLGLEHGFIAPDIVIVTEADILGERMARKVAKKRRGDNFLTEVSSLDEGDLVVHLDHGVGRFLELETVNAAGVLNDCLKIEYAGGDKLYVPVENMEVLSRFGSDASGDGNSVQLDKLGGAGWQARKAKAKKDLMVMADKLLKIAAARQLQKTEAIRVHQPAYDEFAARFPFAETDDQARAIDGVIESLSKNHPMDRLVCGDVGFGKTEVAIRAAYVAASDGYQVALVVPTTLLARQHYKNFMQRFAGTGIRVEQLSRLVSAREAERVKRDMVDGSAQIVIGTHALFGENIQFSNLGLLIVDEEQRFGVKQKEKLKALKTNVHVLTLTATPIPRTLQMALTGVKEMSLITTPPVDRLAVRSFVMPHDPMVIREALMREHYRGGQSFYVCPRIKDMRDIEDMLAEIVPEIKVIAAHGQLNPQDLEDRMQAFTDGQYGILLATNIIESGIDIASANTMIIHRADMFGLSQLYQIRGRIGRSKIRAYAYLTYQSGKILNQNAMKRLEVMETLDSLGAGFQLASHDMDIRGAGNLLGDQQSGHIKEIGVELYQQMLEDAVAAARAGVDFDDLPNEDGWSPTIALGTSVLIPEGYVQDLSVRMSLYRRLQDLLEPADIDSFAAELVDRFGDFPNEVQNLLDIVTIKQLAKRAGISSVEAGPKGAVLTFHNNAPPNVDGLMGWMTSKAGAVKLRPDQKLSILRTWDTPSRRVKGVQGLISDLAGLV
jgi:transcription-repair coupling factor (superfamily II helicase)